MSDQIVAWTARLCVALWLVAVALRLRSPAVPDRRTTNPSSGPWAVAWSGAAIVLLLHTVAAFHFRHHWSHQDALRHTAEQTARVTGIDWGGGLYVNYVFLAWWLIDAVGIGLAKTRFLTVKYRLGADLAVAFMMLNATVVFGPPVWLFLGPAAAVVLLLACLTRRGFNESAAPRDSITRESATTDE